MAEKMDKESAKWAELLSWEETLDNNCRREQKARCEITKLKYLEGHQEQRVLALRARVSHLKAFREYAKKKLKMDRDLRKQAQEEGAPSEAIQVYDEAMKKVKEPFADSADSFRAQILYLQVFAVSQVKSRIAERSRLRRHLVNMTEEELAQRGDMYKNFQPQQKKACKRGGKDGQKERAQQKRDEEDRALRERINSRFPDIAQRMLGSAQPRQAIEDATKQAAEALEDGRRRKEEIREKEKKQAEERAEQAEAAGWASDGEGNLTERADPDADGIPDLPAHNPNADAMWCATEEMKKQQGKDKRVGKKRERDGQAELENRRTKSREMFAFEGSPAAADEGWRTPEDGWKTPFEDDEDSEREKPTHVHYEDKHAKRSTSPPRQSPEERQRYQDGWRQRRAAEPNTRRHSPHTPGPEPRRFPKERNQYAEDWRKKRGRAQSDREDHDPRSQRSKRTKWDNDVTDEEWMEWQKEAHRSHWPGRKANRNDGWSEAEWAEWELKKQRDREYYRRQREKGS